MRLNFCDRCGLPVSGERSTPKIQHGGATEGVSQTDELRSTISVDSEWSAGGAIPPAASTPKCPECGTTPHGLGCPNGPSPIAYGTKGSKPHGCHYCRTTKYPWSWYVTRNGEHIRLCDDGGACLRRKMKRDGVRLLPHPKNPERAA